ncbi:MAG: DNRLRE domain-containing protein [Bacteroidales bacterium]
MRTIFRSTALILLVVFAFSSCEKNSGTSKGTAKFSIASIEQSSQLKSTWADTDMVSYHLLVSVEDADRSPVLTDHPVPVYLFGPGYISEELEMNEGDYFLTKFMLIDPSGTVIAATPMEGSPLAYLVTKPLPLQFRIRGGTATTVSPELLAVGSHTPGDFGYLSFGGSIIKPLDFYTVCIIDNPLSMSPVQPPVEATLTVFAGNNWHYSFRLKASVNHLVIRGGYEFYTFLVEKEGYPPRKFEFTARELNATTEISPLVLKIPYDSNQWKVLVLQPGPEEGKDAMISNLEPEKNFGDHRFFEATFISEPILTVMRSNESLISFDMNAVPRSATIKRVILNFWYDLPMVWDSTIFYPSGSGGIQWTGGVLQKITEPWEEDKVTWSVQPKTTEVNQVYISPFILNTNMITVDVTRLYVRDPVTDAPAIQGYGMFFRLWPQEWVPGFRFASGDFPEAGMRPKLTIYYTLP